MCGIEVMAINVRGVFLGCKYAIPRMVEQGSRLGDQRRELCGDPWLLGAPGCLHCVQGCRAFADPEPGGAVRAQGDPHQRDLPGPGRDPDADGLAGQGRGGKRVRLARNPTGRFGKPEEIVKMAIYLASDESRWTNGASLVVDGGISVNYF